MDFAWQPSDLGDCTYDSWVGGDLAFRWVGTALKLKESRVLRALLPETAQERGVFTLLSVSAGFGEEVAYRGYAIPVLIPITGVAGAVFITSIVFGGMHAYQGALGIIRTRLWV